ncbi:hypothetical protein HK098_000724 [Nowakowskiella sp. JEL0407]|nr:hypothetical protein HK098_000724 [Nowakowskiella sp. JEL0407]
MRGETETLAAGHPDPYEPPSSLDSLKTRRLSASLTGDNSLLDTKRSHRTSWVSIKAAKTLTMSSDSSDETAATTDSLSDYNWEFDFMDPEDIIDSSLPDPQKTSKITQAFIRAASNGDVSKVKECLAEYKDWIRIDEQDVDGTTALIYASCFGHADVTYLLLENNAKVDERDRNGWTPLMWAVSNGHEKVARILIEGGANKHLKSNRGRTIKELIGRTGTIEMARVLDYEPVSSDRDSSYSDSDFNFDSDSETVVSGAFGKFSHSPIPSRSPSSLSHVSTLPVDELGLFDENDDEVVFEWDKCNLDQMFVFNESEMDFILDLAAKLKPTKASLQKPVPANIFFLCARYAHYFNSQDMVDKFLRAVIEKIVMTVQRSATDTNVIAFWISNCTQLLYYLKRDDGLVTATFETQCQLSELIHEISILLVREVERRLVALLSESILDHNAIEGLNNVRFENVLSTIIKPRRTTNLLKQDKQPSTPTSPLATTSGAAVPLSSPTLSSPPSPLPSTRSQKHLKSHSHGTTSTWKPASPSRSSSSSLTSRIFSRKWPYKVTPHTLTTVLTSTLTVLQSCLVHREIISQIFTQIFHFLGAELFNRIITDKTYCSRSKALQIRMNVSAIEEWVRKHHVQFSIQRATILVEKLKPVVQLLQFLQVITSERDVVGFAETMKSLDSFTFPMAKRAMVGYRYEVGEESLPSEVEDYVRHMVECLTIVQRDKIEAKTRMTEESRKQSSELLKARKVKRSGNGSAGLRGLVHKRTVSLDLSAEEVAAEVDEVDALEELLDPTVLLPFQVPVLVGGGEDGGSVADETWPGGALVPTISEDVMKLLDKRTETHETQETSEEPVKKEDVKQESTPKEKTKTAEEGKTETPVSKSPPRSFKDTAVLGLKTIGRGLGAAVGASLSVVDAAINAATPSSPLPDNIPTPPWAQKHESSPLANPANTVSSTLTTSQPQQVQQPNTQTVSQLSKNLVSNMTITTVTTAEVEAAARQDRRASIYNRRASIIDRRGSIITDRRPSVLIARPFSVTPAEDGDVKVLPPAFDYNSDGDDEDDGEVETPM